MHVRVLNYWKKCVVLVIFLYSDHITRAKVMICVSLRKEYDCWQSLKLIFMKFITFITQVLKLLWFWKFVRLLRWNTNISYFCSLMHKSAFKNNVSIIYLTALHFPHSVNACNNSPIQITTLRQMDASSSPIMCS